MNRSTRDLAKAGQIRPAAFVLTGPGGPFSSGNRGGKSLDEGVFGRAPKNNKSPGGRPNNHDSTKKKKRGQFTEGGKGKQKGNCTAK